MSIADRTGTEYRTRACTRTSFRWILSYDDHPALLGSETLYAEITTKPTATTVAQGGQARNIIRRRVGLQHSASCQKKRRQVPELILTTLADSDCEGVGEAIQSQPAPLDAVSD